MSGSHSSDICYLCNKPIVGKVSREHVFPQQYFPKELRAKLGPQMLTLPSHLECNKSFEQDEEYVYASLYPLTDDASVSPYLANDLERKLGRERGQPLLRQVLGEFIPRPAGLYLPRGKVVKSIDSKRMNRVFWKMARGLHWHHFGGFLPEDAGYRVEVFMRDSSMPQWYQNIFGPTATLGEYTGIFGYRVQGLGDVASKRTAEAWSLLLWDSFVAVVRVVPEELRQ